MDGIRTHFDRKLILVFVVVAALITMGWLSENPRALEDVVEGISWRSLLVVFAVLFVLFHAVGGGKKDD